MNDLLAIYWDINPFFLQTKDFSIRFYSIFFVLGFFIGYFFLRLFFKHSNKSQQEADLLIILMFVLIVIGGRLGHVFFYNPEYYLSYPEKIFRIHEGGLASHGAIFLSLLALPIYCKIKKISFWWLTDRLVIPISLGAAFVRLGNLMNSEIYGTPTSLPWGFVFVRNGETIAKHPTQIYEATLYVLVFIFLFWIYRKYQKQPPKALITAWFLILLWSSRFFIEFLKESQSIFDYSLPLKMGQILSIPLIIIGFILLYASKKKHII